MKKFTKVLSAATMTSSASSNKLVPVDESGCPTIEGLLFKKNAHGEWKKRHGKLSNWYFITNKPHHKKATNEIKEKIDFREIASIGVYDDILEIEMLNGETLAFKYDPKDPEGHSIDDWYSAMSKRHKWTKENAPPLENKVTLLSKSTDECENETAEGLNILSEHRIHITGYLHKKSHNKYHGFQERFVKVEGKYLNYYKKKNDDKSLGTASMETADFVRPFDATAECNIFEIQDENRVFVFQTPSHSDMLKWVNSINKVITAYKEQKRASDEAKLASQTPINVRIYDEIGEIEFLAKIEIELSELYPTIEMEELTLKEHISCAGIVVQYLLDFVTEIQCFSSDKGKRYDVLAAVMTEVNATLTERFAAFVEGGADTNTAEVTRHPIFEAATLGDLHQVIDFISSYKLALNGIKCPLTAFPAIVMAKTPKSCGLFDMMPKICALYVHGGSAGAKGGAAAHLYEHCMKVWESVVNNPEEMIQKHSNGSFYTHSPIDMWEAINQHVSLATSTKSPVLHVMIAEKVVVSLSQVFNSIITYVQTLDTSNKPELREIELEYISALANDTALHIEEVIELIDTFTIAEIRERIDDIFDPLTTLLVQCGQTCLKRLAGLVMSDVQGILDEVFTPDWLEGNQVSIATATISDYMSDFETFLVEFWSAKFVYTILEAVILAYIRVILFKYNSQNMGVFNSTLLCTPTPDPSVKTGFFSSLMRKTKEISVKISTNSTTTPQCCVDEESLGRLAQDVNTLNAFFSKKAGQDIATEFLAIINEISLMLFLDGVELVQHTAKRAIEFPSAAQAIKLTALAVMRLRHDTIVRQHYEMMNVTLDPIIASAPEVLQQQEKENIVEDRLSLLYSDLVPQTLLPRPTAATVSLARKMKNMSHIDLGSTNKTGLSRSSDPDDGSDIGDSDADSDADTVSEGRSSLARKRTMSTGLVDDVLEVLNQQDAETAAALQAAEEERLREEEIRQKIGVLAYDGYMEKKSPAHNLWQRRWFKLATRETLNPESPYSYNFMYYKKQGGTVIKSIDAYDPDLAQQEKMPVGNSAEQFVTIRVLQRDGKDHWLRGAKVDRVIRWVNLLSLAAALGYDERLHVWNREALLRHQETAAVYRATPKASSDTQNISATSKSSNSKIATTSSNSKTNSPAGTGKTTVGIQEDDCETMDSAVQKLQLQAEEAQKQQKLKQQQQEEDEEQEEELREQERVEQERQQQRERKIAETKRRAEELAAARREAERLQLEMEQAEQEQAELEREEEQRQARLAAKTTTPADSDLLEDSRSATSASAASPVRGATNPILQKDGKARDVTNPLKRTSSVRRVPPPPPPMPSTTAADVTTTEISVTVAETEVADTALDSSSADIPSPVASPTPSTGKVIRMVGKRRASLDKSTYSTARAAACETASTVSRSSQADDDLSVDDTRCSIDSAPGVGGSNASPLIRSALKKSNLPDTPTAPDSHSPVQRNSELSTGSPGSVSGNQRKTLSRGVSFSSESLKECMDDASKDDPKPVPHTTTASRQPFAAVTEEAPGSDHEGAGDDVSGDGPVSEAVLSTHVARAGVVSGRMYRKSVVVGARPTAPDAPAMREGYLTKKSPAMLVGWQKRYFVTNSNGDIEYYKSEADAHNGSVQPQGVIMIKYIKLDRGVSVCDKSGELSINIGSKTVLLKGKDKAEARAWMTSITMWQLHTA